MPRATVLDFGSSNQPAKPVAAPKPRHQFARVEAWFGIFFTTLLTITIGGMLVTVPELMWEYFRLPEKVWYSLLRAAWIIIDAPFLAMLWYTVLMRGAHVAAQIGRLQQFRWPVSRWLVGLWWLSHFSFGVLMVILAHASNDPALHQPHGIIFLLSTGYGYAANGFLMLATCAFTRSTTIRDFVWRHRLLVDVVLGVAGTVLPLMAHGK